MLKIGNKVGMEHLMRRKIFIVMAVIALLGFIAFFYEERIRHPPNHIVLYGNVDVRQVDLGFRVPGKVDFLYFEEGDLVAEGDLVGHLDIQPYKDQVDEAAAHVEAAKASLANAEKILARRHELIGDGSVSKEDLDNAEASQKVQAAELKQAEAQLQIAKCNLSYTKIYAPTAATILTRVREPGTVVNAADPVYTLSISSPVWIRAYCSEPELGIIYPGMEATISTDTSGGKTYSGKVGFISPVAEFTPKTVETTTLRTDLVYRLRIYADNPGRGLRQGMPVTVLLHSKQAAQ
jgi:HlyD family secretion protein